MDVNVIIDELPFASVIDHPCRENIPLPPDKKFHIFFSYRDVPRDKLWVKKVINRLETEHGYTCCDHERDFLPGTKIMDNIKDGINNSDKVVVVFSKDAIDSEYVVLEAEIAHKLSIERRKNLLIPVFLDDCAVPEEFMLLTHIDAREGTKETTWWPRLLKSIESRGETSRSLFHAEEKGLAGGPAFAIDQICSIEAKYSCCQCGIQYSKYVPVEFRTEAFGVPFDLIRATCRDLLQSPRVVLRHKCCCFATTLVVLGFVILPCYFTGFIIWCLYAAGMEFGAEAYVISSILSVIVIIIAVLCFVGYKKCYSQNPDSVNKDVIEHNRNLSKYGVMVTVVAGCMWKKASIIFYKCKFELCKKYVIHHLVKEESIGKFKEGGIPDSGQMITPNDDSQLPSGTREVTCSVEQSIRNVNAIDPMKPEEFEDAADVADNEPLLSIQETENLDYENEALNLLLSYTPEYFALAYANKLKNPKEDRHGIDIMCLCQYLEKANKDFRNKVKRIQSLRCKIGIEENDKDENNKRFENILL